MAEQKIKFKVSIKELSFEFEGTRDVGQALQAGLNRSLGSLLDTQRVAMAIPAGPAFTPAINPGLFDTSPTGNEVLNGHSENGHTATGKATAPVPVAVPAAEKAKKTRKSGGESAMNLVRGLIAEGYFKEARTVESIKERLRLKGHNNPSGLSSRLQELAKKDLLFRNSTEGGYIYKDTPFNDAPATPAPPVEPAE